MYILSVLHISDNVLIQTDFDVLHYFYV